MNSSDIMAFAPADEPRPFLHPTVPWTILIVDDEKDVHTVTRIALRNLRFQNRPMEFLSAYSSREAQTILQSRPDIALALIDVVMEAENSGLELVKYIRETMGNRALRIILRTGQPGFAPIVSITEDYEIDDYKEKAELTSQRLTMSVIASLRTFGYFSELQKLNAELEARVAMRTAELERLSLVDPLTGAANRRHFDARAQAELAEAQRHGRALAIVSLDIDHFKVINDTWGHSGGDEVLKHIVTIAQQCLRPGDLLARIGGEEFVLVLPDTTDTAAAVVAERIRATLAESPVGLKAGLVSYTASFGVSELASDEPSVANALERSDQALYAAKNAGRNQVVLASSLDQPIAHSA